MKYNGNTEAITDTIIYCRVSTETQNFESQQYSCEQYCNENNFNINKIYHETGSARSIMNLNLLQEIINDNVDVNLVVYSVDRLTRNVQDAELIYNAFKDRNINVCSVMEQGIFNLKHIWDNRVQEAARESELISVRVKRSIALRRFKGDHIGNAGYGYKIVYIKTQKDSDIMDYEDIYNQENYNNYSNAGEIISNFIAEKGNNNSVFKPLINLKTHYNRRVLMHDINEMKIVNFIKSSCDKRLSCKEFSNHAEYLVDNFNLNWVPIRFYKEFDDSDDGDYSPDNEEKTYWFTSAKSNESNYYSRIKKSFISNSKKILINHELIAAFLRCYDIKKRGEEWNAGMVKGIANA